MNGNRFFQQVMVAIFILLLVGCGAPAAEPTPEPPTDTPTPVPPTATPTIERPTATLPVLVTNIEMLIGNWQPLSTDHAAMFLQLNSDSTCRQSYSLKGLIDSPQVECTFTLEGANLSMTVVELHGVPECPTPTGTYEVRLVAEDQIRLVPKKDSCVPRKNSTQGEYQRIP
jgi:hypothetical protein